MKKILAIVLMLVCVIPFAFAEGVDLSILSYAELVALSEQCTREMMQRDEWQEVVVPVGLYQVGVEIPAGKWTISAAYDYFLYVCGASLRNNGLEPTYDVYGTVVRPDSSVYETGDTTEFTLDLKEGMWIMIKSSSAIFRPYTGPNFSFK